MGKRQDSSRALEVLLCEAGFPACDPASFDEDARWAFERSDGVERVLASRGWVVGFDAEGDFFEPGAHARIVEQLLEAARIKVQDVRDEYPGGVGWMITITERTGGAPRTFAHRSPRTFAHSSPSPDFDDDGPSASDWADLDLICSVAGVFLGAAGWELLALETGDQTVTLAVVPNEVWSRAREAKVLGARLRVRPDASVKEMDAKKAKETARISQLKSARRRLGHYSWQGREQACTEATFAALRPDCALSKEVVRLASDDAFFRIREWADRARSRIGEVSAGSGR